MADAPYANEDIRLALLQECQILGLSADPELDDLTRLAANICATPIAWVSVVDASRQWIISRVGPEFATAQRDATFCSQALSQPDQLLVVADPEDWRFPAGLHFYAGAPLCLDGLVLGTLCVLDSQPRQLSSQQLDGLKILARQVIAQIRLRRKKAALLQARADREDLFHRPLDLFCTVNPEGYFQLINPSFCQTLGYSQAEMEGRRLFDFIHPDDLTPTQLKLEELNQGQAVRNFVNRYRCKDDSYRWLSWNSVLATGDNIYGSAHDITEHKRSEEQVKLSEALIKQFVTHAPAAIAMLDRDMRYLMISNRWLSDYRLSEKDILGKSHYEVFPNTPERLKEVHRRVLAGAVERCEEDSFLRPDGTLEWLQWEKQPWYCAPGEIGGILLLTQVITERRAAEQLLRSSLLEKETLLKEVHHRVKNNLQVITSLLQLQSNGISQPVLRDLFREAQDRVRAMALIHEGLYRSGQLGAIEFSTHLLELANNLLNSYATNISVELQARTEPLQLEIDLAVPLSLIVNELVTNSFKHAFRDGPGGILRLELGHLPDGQLWLLIGDNGPGLPREHTISLGLNIVNILTKQIGGRLELLDQPGTVFRLTFPRSRTGGSL